MQTFKFVAEVFKDRVDITLNDTTVYSRDFGRYSHLSPETQVDVAMDEFANRLCTLIATVEEVS